LLQGKGERGRTFQISRPDIGYILIIPASFSQVKGFFINLDGGLQQLANGSRFPDKDKQVFGRYSSRQKAENGS
jgi:hypothetical protein